MAGCACSSPLPLAPARLLCPLALLPLHFCSQLRETCVVNFLAPFEEFFVQELLASKWEKEGKKLGGAADESLGKQL